MKCYEVFDPRDGLPVKTVRSERAAVRATRRGGLDYALKGDGWPELSAATDTMPVGGAR